MTFVQRWDGWWHEISPEFEQHMIKKLDEINELAIIFGLFNNINPIVVRDYIKYLRQNRFAKSYSPYYGWKPDKSPLKNFILAVSTDIGISQWSPQCQEKRIRAQLVSEMKKIGLYD